MAKQQSISDWFSELSPMMKLVVIIVACVIIYLIWNVLKSFLGNLSESAESTGEIAALQVSGQKASYAAGVYNDLADSLENAMAGPGTWVVQVGGVFDQMKNDLDVALLEKAFGIRDGANLSAWLNGEWLISVYDINQGLRAKGITKQF